MPPRSAAARAPNSSPPPDSPDRRRTLQILGALGLASSLLPRSIVDARADGPGDDVCASGAQALPLVVPGSRGYLGRLEPRGAPLTLIAGQAGALPPGIVHGGLAYRVRHGGRDFINPTLVAHPGEHLRISFANRLADPTIVHWHGLTVDTQNDGSGMRVIAPGEGYQYDFEVRDRAALYWYHPHPHGQTGEQVYQGLYGAIEVEDEDDAALRRALDVEPGKTEIPLVLQDRRTTGGYKATEADRMHGFLGDAMYVNGRACPYLDTATRLYRFRILNACNARTLCIAWRTASGTRIPMTVIGNDGGLLPAPQPAQQVFLAAAERLDVLVDLRDASVGETMVLESLAFDPMHAEMETPAPAVDHAAMGHGAAPPAEDHSVHEGHVHAGAWPEGSARALMQLRVRRRVAYDRRVPATLSAIAPIDVADARERPFRLGFNKGRWRINDRVFVMGETPIEVARDTTEVWLLRNYHTSMPHAMHLHGFHMDVRERETSPDFIRALAVDAQGRLPTDFGRRDTVLVWPGESVRVAIRFALPFNGPQTYVFHCHNLEHEDGGMMLGVKVA